MAHLNHPDEKNLIVSDTATSTIGFFGATPVTKRTGWTWRRARWQPRGSGSRSSEQSTEFTRARAEHHDLAAVRVEEQVRESLGE